MWPSSCVTFSNHIYWLKKVKKLLWEWGFGFGLRSYKSVLGSSLYNYLLMSNKLVTFISNNLVTFYSVEVFSLHLFFKNVINRSVRLMSCCFMHYEKCVAIISNRGNLFYKDSVKLPNPHLLVLVTQWSKIMYINYHCAKIKNTRYFDILERSLQMSSSYLFQ